MASNVYVTGTGTMYIANSASSAADSLIPFPSADLVSALTSTPVSIPVADAAMEKVLDQAGLDPNNSSVVDTTQG